MRTVTIDKPQQRRQRSDAGTVRLTERDLMIFRWLAEMKAVYEDDLAVLISRLPATPGAVQGHRPGAAAVRMLISRWKRGGYASATKLIYGKPRMVRLLPAGARLVGEDSFKETSETTAYHQCEVARVRLWLEGQPPREGGRIVRWESERQYRQDLAAIGMHARDELRVHVPDGVAYYEHGHALAVEVERGVKAPARLARIVEDLLTGFPMTLYAVVNQEVANAVRAAEKTARRVLNQRGVSPERIGALTIIEIPAGVD